MEEKHGMLANYPDYMVCTCMEVMYSELKQAIEAGATDFQEVSDQFMVGTGCSSCVQEVMSMLDTYKK